MALLSTNVDWSKIDFEALDLQNSVVLKATEAGQQFEAFLRNRCRLIVGEPKVIAIDRATPFNPAEFIGAGWSFWLGPADGDGLSGEPEQDSRSLALTEMDFSKILLEAHLKKNETYTTGEERIKRLASANRVRLDLGVFKTLWNNKALIPASWKEKTGGNTTYIFFDGQVLRSPLGRRYTLYLYWYDGKWYWDVRWLDNIRYASNPSAVLAS
jgi:hypothetical protein